MFLTVLIPGPRNPKQQMDIFLQPLIAELNQLWECGVTTYDVHKCQNFQLKAALCGQLMISSHILCCLAGALLVD